MRILAASGQQAGSLAYRVLLPLNCLQRAGYDVSFLPLQTTAMRIPAALFEGKDFLLIQKVSNPQWYQLLDALPSHRRPFVLYELDDLLWGMDERNPEYETWSGAAKGALECMRLADAIVCSTPTLLRKVEGLLPDAIVRTAPNYIDFGYRDWDTPLPKLPGIAFGWAGGHHHYGDEAPMVKALREILDTYPDASFAFCGHHELFSEWRSSIGAKPSQVLFRGSLGFERCANLPSQFHVGLAPLPSTPFNECKSDLKLIEYGAWGLPYIASDVAPYRRYHSQTKGRYGFLCRTSEDWREALYRLGLHRGPREAMGAAHRVYVRSHRGPEACQERWVDLLDDLGRWRERNERKRQQPVGSPAIWSPARSRN